MTALKPASAAVRYEASSRFWEACSTGQVPHVAKTLFEHLQGTYELLREWGNPPDVCHAGLCHALYGTDGLPVALLDVRSERPGSPASSVRVVIMLPYFSSPRSTAF